MFFREPFCQERVPNGPREREVQISKRVKVTNLCLPEAKFPSGETMWVN